MPMNGLVNANPSLQQQGGPTEPSAGGANMSGLVQQPQGEAQGPPQLTHEQTVTALNHFEAVKKQLVKIAKHPTLGKENLRPVIFDATADLLGDGIFSLPQIMNEIKSLPTDPPGQKKWVMDHLQNVQKAEIAILEHHAQTSPGTLDLQQEQQAAANPITRSHSNIMAEISRNFKGA